VTELITPRCLLTGYHEVVSSYVDRLSDVPVGSILFDCTNGDTFYHWTFTFFQCKIFTSQLCHWFWVTPPAL